MKTMNECGFQKEQVVQAWSVGGMLLVMLGLVVMACFSSGCTRDVYVDPSFTDDVSGDNGEDDVYNPPMPENDSEDAYEEGDCSGPWGCKQYADSAVLPPECEDDDGCANGFECAKGQCVPAAEADVTEDSGDTLEQGHYPLEITTEPEPECHCGVGYACEDGFCVKIGGNDNPPNDEPEPQPEPDVVEQAEDVSPEPTEDVVVEGDANVATSDVTADSASPEASQSELADVAAQDAEAADVVAEVEADTAETNEIAEAPEVVADGGVAPEPFNGAKCTITCLNEYTNVRIWWAFTSADVASGTSFSIPKAELCLWGEMAFQFNCFVPDGKWGDYMTVEMSCSPAEYDLVDTGIHGKVKFDESCW